MNLFLIGLNHKTAPIEIRENFYLTPLQQDLFLSELKNNPSVIEAFMLSTCNRVEVYLHLLDDAIPDEFLKLILKIKKIPFQETFQKHFYIYKQESVLDHLLRVACGLDSLVVGEKQILGQIKEAFERARDRGMFSKYFNVLSNIAIRTAKKAQTETEIGVGGSSVSWAAITVAERMRESLKDKSILVIGAGEMSKLTLEQITNKGFKQLYLMNRTQAHVQDLADKYKGTAVGFCDIKEVLTQIDLCICAVDAPHYVLDLETVSRIQPSDPCRRILFIDISMPRNIDPRISELDFVQLLSIDDLDKAITTSMKKRLEAVTQVEKIIADKLNLFYAKTKKITEINPSLNLDEVSL